MTIIKEGQRPLPGMIVERQLSQKEKTRHKLRGDISHIHLRRREIDRQNRLNKWWDRYMTTLFSGGTDTWIARLGRKDGEDSGQDVLQSESIDDDTRVQFDLAFDAARSFHYRLAATQIVRKMAREGLKLASNKNFLDQGLILKMIVDRSDQLAINWQLSESYRERLRDEVYDQKRFKV